MKKIIFTLIAFIAISFSANGQNKIDGLAEKVNSFITSKITTDSTLECMNAEYEIVYETNTDVHTMYNNLMTRLYMEKNDILINENDGMIRIKIEKEEKNEKTQESNYHVLYRIFLKDGKFKIVAYMKSKQAYKYWGFMGDTTLSEVTLNMPKWYVLDWACAIIDGAKREFDF